MHYLHGEAKKIESAMATTQTEIMDQEKDIGRLQGKLKRIGSMDSLYVRFRILHRKLDQF